MILLDGKKVSQSIKDSLKVEIDELVSKNIKPGLGIILVGDRKDSHTYVRMKKNACNEVNIYNYDIMFPEDVDEETLLIQINNMNQNNDIHGILVQLPYLHILMRNFIIMAKLVKDVDGFHPKILVNLP